MFSTTSNSRLEPHVCMTESFLDQASNESCVSGFLTILRTSPTGKRQQNDRIAALLGPQSLGHFVTIHFRHSQIENYYFGMGLLDSVERGWTAELGADFVFLGPQQGGES